VSPAHLRGFCTSPRLPRSPLEVIALSEMNGDHFLANILVLQTYLENFNYDRLFYSLYYRWNCAMAEM
jgi:hypothetical protein